MTYRDTQAPARTISSAIIAGFALFFAAALSIAGINLFGVRIGFGFMPLVVLAIWPRPANALASLGIVFFAGLFTDWATGGVVGQWALIFVLIWGFLRPQLRSAPFAPLSFLLIWLATCGLAFVILSFTGYFIFRVFPDLASLGRQMIFATCLLPVFLLLRRGLAVRFNDHDDWG